MFFSKNTIWLGLRGCLYCGSLFRSADGLCTICSEDLWSWQPAHQRLFHQRIHKLEVLSLFQWLPGRQEVLSKVIHSLKGKNGDELWNTYADEFQKRRIPEKTLDMKKSFFIIPSPSKTKSPDHAQLFAHALVRKGGGELYNCLLRKDPINQQKNKSRRQRQKVTFVWSENFTKQEFIKVSSGKRIIFVDDVVTTGSTARAAWISLGKPRDFAVWALAQRGLSCGASSSLL